MIILHTSDWHLGQKLHDRDRHEEHLIFLDWLLKTIKEKRVDVLLVAGDIFDTANPPHQAKSLYYDFLTRLKSTGCKHVVITGGNHDSPGELNAPKDILKFLNIHVIGCATEDIADEVILLQDGEKLSAVICAVPFLRDRDIRKSVTGEDYDQIQQKVKEGIVNHYKALAELVSNYQDVPIIAMGHLYAAGVSTSESEKEIHIGNLGQIPANEFPAAFNYIALGHIHRPQLVGKMPHIRYSGSPVPLSFSEYADKKVCYLLHCHSGKVNEIEDIPVPLSRRLLKFDGTIEDLAIKANAFKSAHGELMPWAEIKVILPEPDPHVQDSVKSIFEGKAEVLLVRAESLDKSRSLEEMVGYMESLDELSPMDVFIKKCESVNVDLDKNPQLLLTFKELLSSYYEGKGNV
jgi:DNA repair protein SbcD/Mre11